MSSTNKQIERRIYLISGVLLLVILGVVVRMIDLQFFKAAEIKERASYKVTDIFTIEASRGNIYDDHGSLLATSVPKYDVYFDPVAVNEQIFASEIVDLSKSLSGLLGRSATYYQNLFRQARANGKRYVSVTKNLGYSQYMELRSFPIFKYGRFRGGIIVEEYKEREYPMKGIAERSIGHERRDKKGVYEVGLEGAFDTELRGMEGKRLRQRISKNQWKPIYDENEVEPRDGYDLYATIDMNIQDIAHHALLLQLERFQADHGTVIVMEVKTGAVKAISNLGKTKNGKYYERLNYAINEAHEPGSTFKTIALLAALADKKIDTSTVVDTKQGKERFYGRTISDSRRGGHGEISAARALEVSSNIGLAKLIDESYKDNPEEFIERLKSWGIHEPIGLSIKGEGKPFIPEPGGSQWSRNALPSMSYGYNLRMTPLQQLMVYNAIANDGVMVKPRFVNEIRSRNKQIKEFKTEVVHKQIAPEETIKQMQEMLKNAVKRGTGSSLYSPYFSIAGKTGTAQAEYWMDDWASNRRYISSFAGYFPAENPKYSCIVVIHKPRTDIGYYGGMVTGDVFKRIAQKITTNEPQLAKVSKLDSLTSEVAVKYRKYDELIEEYSTVVPEVIGMEAMDAVSLLENLGLKVELKGRGVVRSQSIRKGQELKNGQTIILNLS
ncbi:MAG TPA: penicillin-binding protein [Flavobacteriaceae bacterium]|nr:penicillin-binding protein [Flavobacteriaceae bacterium]